jgi:sigma-B regulation protein RsbU (phosphoserine phosphatase)
MTRDAEVKQLLVVDDDPGMCRAVARVLGPLYSVTTALSLAEAREKLAEQQFQVALVDVQLTDGEGYTLCHEIHGSMPDTDVILMTGSMTHPDEKLFRSLEEGAFYFLFKPFERRVLRALVDRCLSLQTERRAKEAYAAALADDLQNARHFQASLLPRRPITESGWHIVGRCRPCDALGGDFYVSRKDSSGAIDFAICDIVGHGVKAAMYAGMVRSTMDAARRRNPDPANVLQEVATGLGFFEPSTIVTMVYGRLGRDGAVRYFNAGHPPLLWQRADGSIDQLPATGILLSSALAGHPRQVEEIMMRPGDRLVTYTDGILEAQDPAGTELGLDRLLATMAEGRSDTLDKLLDRALTLVNQHCGGRPLDDDVTLLVLDRLTNDD